ncbi:unnamed protein product [Sphagnum jensenii]|uniref:Uncharacterized protein n=1 Tax=Sphagnum jensenii TaxID=128206 RepID=A0ABP0WAW5_9BRYO
MATFRSCIFKLAHCGSNVSQLRGEQLPTTPALAAADQHSTCRLRGVRRILCPIEIPTPLKNQSGAQILGRNYHHHPLGFSARFDGMNTRGGGRMFDSHPSTSSSEEEQEEEEEGEIDAFTDHAFGGNSATVCYLPYEKNDRWLQLIAQEFNLSETAFLVKRQNTTARSKDAQKERLLEVDDESGKTLKDVQQHKKGIAVEEENEFDLRRFIPTVEVDLCGHATLASAHLLFASGIVLGDTVLFNTKSGVLKATKVSGYEEYEELPEEEDELGKRPERRRPGGKGVVQLDFPLVPAVPCNDTFLLSEALGGVAIKWAGETSLGDYLVELPSSADVEHVKPQFHKMMDFHGRGGVIITALAPEDSEYDFVSRFFCPKGGISEVLHRERSFTLTLNTAVALRALSVSELCRKGLGFRV